MTADSLEKKTQNIFKSEAERRIAYFLTSNSIRYKYEQGVLINGSKERSRIWYPDFYLPEFKTYVEYFGLAGKKDYDQGIKRKNKVYSQIGLDVISIYPWMFSGNWQDYLMRELKHRTVRNYASLMTKPYWKKPRSLSTGYNARRFATYGGKNHNRY